MVTIKSQQSLEKIVKSHFGDDTAGKTEFDKKIQREVLIGQEAIERAKTEISLPLYTEFFTSKGIPFGPDIEPDALKAKIENHFDAQHKDNESSEACAALEDQRKAAIREFGRLAFLATSKAMKKALSPMVNKMIKFFQAEGIQVPDSLMIIEDSQSKNSFMPDIIVNNPIATSVLTGTGLLAVAFGPLLYKFYNEKPLNRNGEALTLREYITQEFDKSLWLKCALAGAVGVVGVGVAYKYWPAAAAA